MYNNEIKDKFVELRAARKSFGDISQELGVAQSTLHCCVDERDDEAPALAPAEVSNARSEIPAPSLLPSSKVPSGTKSNETERFQKNVTTQHRNTNDLQQSIPQSFDFPGAPPESETSLNPLPPTLNQPENPAKIRPFTSQNSEPHNPNLSTAPHLEGRAPSTPPPRSSTNPAGGRAMCPHSVERLNPSLIASLLQDESRSAEALA